MTGLLKDLRHAFRLYRRTPFTSGVAVLVLAVAMAFVTAFLSMYVDLVLRPHSGFERSGRLVTIGQTDGRQINGIRVDLIGRMADEVGGLDSAAGLIASSLRRVEGEELVRVELVTEQFFPGLMPRLHSGRGFELADHQPEAAQVVVVSYRYWQDELEGRDVLDAVIELDVQPVFWSSNDSEADEETDKDFRIIGIMAPEMTGTMAAGTGIWLPYERLVDRLFQIDERMVASLRSSFTMQAVGRRGPGVSTESLIRQLGARYGDRPEDLQLQAGFRLEAIDGAVSNMTVKRDATRQLQLFLTASVLIALVAAANVSLFLLARAPGRRRELGIRMAVGAPLGRIARQLASEAAVLVVAATALGLVMSIWLGNFLRGLAFLRQAAWRDVTLLDWRVLGLAGLFLLVLTALVSLAPIVGLKRLGIARSSREVAARAGVAQRFAGTLQIAIAGTLGGAAVAFGWYLGSLTLGDPGYEDRDRQVVQYSVNVTNLDSATYNDLMQRAEVEMPRRRATIEAIPGVTGIAFGSAIPGTNSSFGGYQVPDPRDPSTQLRIPVLSIDSGFVDLLRFRLLHGRGFETSGDNEILVNQAFARLFFGRDNVVGEKADMLFRNSPSQGPGIVGVLEDLSLGHPSAEVGPVVFQPLSRAISGSAVIATSLTPAALQQALERLTESGELEIRVMNVRPLRQLRDNIIAPDRARSWLTIGAAALVVVLAAIGFYGTQRYLVTAGRREYAIRASLGAGPKALGRLVLMRGLKLGLPGLALGTVLAFIAVAWLRDDFVSREISPALVTLVVVAGLVLLLVGASLGPARHAMRTQPAPLLRED